MPLLRILTIVDHYLPGTRAGGPVGSIADLVEALGDHLAFDILTADRDLGDDVAYPGIRSGEWHRRGKASVRYLAPGERTLRGWCRILRGQDADVLYLNSLFARSTIKILALRRLGVLPRMGLVLAPRGELEPGALSINRARKRTWLFVAAGLRLFAGTVWQAADEREAADLRRALGSSAAIRVARQLPLQQVAAPPAGDGAPGKQPGHARIVFISRISPKKNLDSALRVLQRVTGRAEFDIYGPIEDREYWARCSALMSAMPAGVAARYGGALPPAEVQATFARYHLFLFPTRGENFGRVIVESLLAGCPVLLSDRTPWQDAATSGGGWEAPLDRLESFVERVNEMIAMGPAEFARMSAAAAVVGARSAASSAAADANRSMFVAAAGRTGGE